MQAASSSTVRESAGSRLTPAVCIRPHLAGAFMLVSQHLRYLAGEACDCLRGNHLGELHSDLPGLGNFARKADLSDSDKGHQSQDPSSALYFQHREGIWKQHM